MQIVFINGKRGGEGEGKEGEEEEGAEEEESFELFRNSAGWQGLRADSGHYL